MKKVSMFNVVNRLREDNETMLITVVVFVCSTLQWYRDTAIFGEQIK